MSKALEKWYEKENVFPCECLCKFNQNDQKYVVDTIVKHSPNNGWYEFVSIKKNTYCIATPITKIEETLQKLDGECLWEYNEFDDSWNGTCGAKWVLDGTPKEHGINFCPKCGSRLIEEDTTCE